MTEDIRSGFDWILNRRGIRRDFVDFVTAVNSPRVTVPVLPWCGGDGNNGSDEGNDREKFGMHCCDVERDSELSETTRRGGTEESSSKRRGLNTYSGYLKDPFGSRITSSRHD